MIASSAAAGENSAAIPALSGHWGRTNFNLEQPPSGPIFIANTMKKRDGTIDDDAARVGDYTNPILTPRRGCDPESARRVLARGQLHT
jgi:hypothetical protein